MKIGTAISDYLCDKLKYGVNISISETPLPSDELGGYDQIVYIVNDKVGFTNLTEPTDASNDIYGESFYNGCIPVVSLKPHDDLIVDVTVDIYCTDKNGNREADPEFTKTASVTMLNLTESFIGSLDAEQDKLYTSDSGGLYLTLLFGE